MKYIDNRASSMAAHKRMVFGIPLRARSASHDWDLVCHNLERTLYSLARQYCRNFGVVIAVHEMPNINTFGLDVQFVEAAYPAPTLELRDNGELKNDKVEKRYVIGCHLRETLGEPIYYMHLDADDLVHPGLVSLVLNDHNRRGYSLERGYVFDWQSGRFGWCDEFAGRRTFNAQCGSCAVVYLEPEEFPVDASDRDCFYAKLKEHRYFARDCDEAGRPLTRIEEYMAIYLVNHGENDWQAYKHRGGSKLDYIGKNLVRDEHCIAEVARDYPPLAARILLVEAKSDCDAGETTL